jgi:hypothetical protein
MFGDKARIGVGLPVRHPRAPAATPLPAGLRFLCANGRKESQPFVWSFAGAGWERDSILAHRCGSMIILASRQVRRPVQEITQHSKGRLCLQLHEFI